MADVSRSAEEVYLGRVIHTIDGHISETSSQLPRAKRELNGISDRDLSAQAVAAHSVGSARERLASLHKMRSSPYFGRVDFHDGELDELLPVYVGLSTLTSIDKNDFLVYDWRAPICSLYYSHDVGPASYHAPGGLIKGEVRLKRQYVIEDAKLVAVYDSVGNPAAQEEQSPTVPLDDMLQEMLGRNASGTMRQIVQTIQAEQDAIIRSDGDVLVVQGPAGSGKTVIALHRAAYLLYQLRRQRASASADTVSAQRILVFSPNRIFSEYIARVLPDLNEGQIRRFVLERHIRDRLRTALPRHDETGAKQLYRLDSKQSHHELVFEQNAATDYRAEFSDFKSSLQMVALLRDFVERLERQAAAELTDVTIDVFEGVKAGEKYRLEVETQVFFNRKDLLSVLERARDRLPLAQRIEAVIVAFRERSKDYARQPWVNDDLRRQLAERSNALRLWAEGYAKKSVLDLYRAVWADEALHKEQGLVDVTLISRIATATLKALSTGFVPYEDQMPLLVLEGLHRGFPPLTNVDHAIIDEAQDYSAIDYHYITSSLPPDCSLTIVGDINQATNPSLGLKSYDELNRIFGKRMQRLDLTRSYRSSYEINEFAASILGGSLKSESVRRTGARPKLKVLDAGYPADKAIADSIYAMQQAGRRTIAILCRTTAEARSLHKTLEGRLPTTLVASDATTFSQGVFVLPVYLAKGLEFDGVLIPDAGREHYGREAERRVLYTACTRALHELHLICPDQISPLIKSLEGVDVETLCVPPPQPPEALVDHPEEAAPAPEAETPKEPIPAIEQEVIETRISVGAQGDTAPGSLPDAVVESSPSHTAAAQTCAPDVPLPQPILLTLPTVRGGAVEIRFPCRVPKKEFDRIRMMFELSEPAFLETEE